MRTWSALAAAHSPPTGAACGEPAWCGLLDESCEGSPAVAWVAAGMLAHLLIGACMLGGARLPLFGVAVFARVEHLALSFEPRGTALCDVRGPVQAPRCLLVSVV